MESPTYNNNKRPRSDSNDPFSNSPESKKLRHELHDTLEPSDSVSQDLDSLIKTFEDQITHQPVTPTVPSHSGESNPNLEFLLEASDDELGLPPTDSAPTEPEKLPVWAESVELGVISRLDEGIPICESFVYGLGLDYVDGEGSVNGDCDGGEYVELEGLFDYADLGFGTSDRSRRSETLPASDVR